MNVLAFDTSNQALSVAIVSEDEVLYEQTINVRRNHSIQLMPAIDEALTQTNLKLEDIDRIAVATGPGSYTGLRIAVTIAKSLAWAQNIELVGVSSLKTIAGNSQEKDQVIVPIFDARRENIYTGLYHRNNKGQLVQLIPDKHIFIDDWILYLNQNYPQQEIKIIGPDARLFFEKMKKNIIGKIKLSEPDENLPSASVLAFLAQREEPTDPHLFVPTYLKLAEAEENWLKDHPDFKGDNLIERTD